MIIADKRISSELGKYLEINNTCVIKAEIVHIRTGILQRLFPNKYKHYSHPTLPIIVAYNSYISGKDFIYSSVEDLIYVNEDSLLDYKIDGKIIAFAHDFPEDLLISIIDDFYFVDELKKETIYIEVNESENFVDVTLPLKVIRITPDIYDLSDKRETFDRLFVIIRKFTDDHSLHRGMQILDNDIKKWLIDEI